MREREKEGRETQELECKLEERKRERDIKETEVGNEKKQSQSHIDTNHSNNDSYY